MRPQVKYHIIYLNRERYSITAMCRFFEVSRSGYYNFVHRIGKKAHDYELAELIRAQQKKCDQTYGYRRMWKWLRRTKKIMRNPKTILRIMKKYEEIERNTIDIIKSKNVPLIIAEKEYGEKMANAVMKETDAKTIYLNTIIRGDYDKDAYINGMKSNIELLKGALK